MAIASKRSGFRGIYGPEIQLELFCDWTRQNIEQNTSLVSVQVRMWASHEGAIYSTSGNSTLQVSIDGQVRDNHIWDARIDKGQNKLIFGKDYTVNHNADGQKTVRVHISANANCFNLYTTNDITLDIPLPQIARGSSLVLPGNLTIGSSHSLTIQRKNNAYRHTLRYAWGSRSGIIASNLEGTASWSVPLDFCREIIHSDTGRGTLYLDTFYNGAKIGEQASLFTATVPNSVKPSLGSVRLEEANGMLAGVTKGSDFIQTLSRIRATASGGAGAYGSIILGYRAEVVGRNISTSENGGLLEKLNFSGPATVRVWAYDSRGRTSDPKDVTIQVLPYHPPVLKATVSRVGTNSDILQIRRSVQIAPLTSGGSQKNTLSFKVFTAPAGTENWTEDTGDARFSSTTISEVVNQDRNLGGRFPSNKSYAIKLVLEDRFRSSELVLEVPTERAVMSYDQNGVGIGKVRERGMLDVAGPSYINGFLRYCTEYAGGRSANDLIEGGPVWTHVDTPSKTWGILETFRIGNLSGKEATQRFTTNDGRVWYRYRHYQTGLFGAWVIQGLNQFYPVGAIYESTNPDNPATFMGGTWERLGNGKVLVGVDEQDGDFSNVGAHTPTFRLQTASNNDKKPFNHFTEVVGQTKESNHLPPYITIYRWRRIA